jgi:transposase
VPKETYAVLEATRNWPFMYDLLNEHVQHVDLVHAKGVRAIANAAIKTDQIDASTLAHLARLNYIPKAYAATKEMRDLRQLLRHREWMVNQRSKAKNRIHAVLAGYNLISPVTDLFGVAGRKYLDEVM